MSSFPAFFARVKGLILSPRTEWDAIAAERTDIPDLYTQYIVVLAAVPPLASFFSSWLFGAAGARAGAHVGFAEGLWRAVFQYALSLPALYLVAFVLSMMAPHFDGRTDDRRAMQHMAFSYTPAWLAAGFALIPGLRWLDILGLYGVYVFWLGVTRLMRVPKDNVDVYALAAFALTVTVAGVHSKIVHIVAPLSTG